MGQYVIDNRPQPIDFECGNGLVKRTLQNCKNLLMARLGEIPYARNMGFFTMLYDMPIQKVREVLPQVLDGMLLWEPDAELVSASAAMDENGEIIITMTVEIDEGEST